MFLALFDYYLLEVRYFLKGEDSREKGSREELGELGGGETLSGCIL